MIDIIYIYQLDHSRFGCYRNTRSIGFFEWVELLDLGANELVGADTVEIVKALQRNFGRVVKDRCSLYGGAQAAQRILELLVK